MRYRRPIAGWCALIASAAILTNAPNPAAALAAPTLAPLTVSAVTASAIDGTGRGAAARRPRPRCPAWYELRPAELEVHPAVLPG